MALFRFTLDGTLLTDEPEGWDKIISELRRDKEVSGQLLLMDLTLFFHGNTDGYNILKPKIDCEGFCSFSTLKIEQSCNNDFTFVEIYNGIIFYTLIKEYLTPCTLECKLKDNSYAAKIANNKNIEAFINVARSKNDEPIFAVFAGTPIGFFDVVTGNYTGSVECWQTKDAFRFIIEYMTDGTMGFVSEYFSTGAGKDIWLTLGERIRLQTGGSTMQLFFSFQKLFEELNKKTPLGFSIETIAGVKTMRIEERSYFFNQSSSVTLNNVKGIVKSVNTSELYAKLNIGGETLDYSLGLTDFPTNIVFIGFKEETFTLTGKCNIDTELNLVSDWIIDSNIIQDVYSNGNSGYDEKIFFIMADGAQVIRYNPFSNAPPYFYNGFLRNSEVAIRWLGAVPNSIALYLDNGNNEFMASSTSDVALGTICGSNTPYQDDFNPPNFNPSGNYNNGTFVQTIPATGLYSYQTINKIFFAEDSGVMTQVIFQDLYVNGIPFFQHSQGIAHGNNTLIFNYSNMYLQAGDLVNIRTYDLFCLPNLAPYYTLTLQTGSSWACISSSTGGGIFQYYNPEDFKAYMYEFDFPLTFADFQTIIANPLKLINFNDGTNFISAWIDNMKYYHREGKAKFVCINALPKNCE